MFDERTLLYCTPFYFKDGNACSPKYFLVLKHIGDGLLVANLPSSQVYVPFPNENVKGGCIDLPDLNFKCYCIPKNTEITDTGFKFQLDTFLYGKWVEDYNIEVLALTYRVENEDFSNCGKISEALYKEILYCLKDSSSIKRKFKRMIIEWLN